MFCAYWEQIVDLHGAVPIILDGLNLNLSPAHGCDDGILDAQRVERLDDSRERGSL